MSSLVDDRSDVSRFGRSQSRPGIHTPPRAVRVGRAVGRPADAVVRPDKILTSLMLLVILGESPLGSNDGHGERSNRRIVAPRSAGRFGADAAPTNTNAAVLSATKYRTLAVPL